MKSIIPVSVHGGHSGEFCIHASDMLEDIIKKYIQEGFAWVGITEHCPPVNDSMRYPDEKEDGISAKRLEKNFEKYILKINSLKKKYASEIKIFTAFESEAYDGYIEHTEKLIKKYKPDYFVGSVHHVNNLCFDFSEEMYGEAVKSAGNIDALYEQYFDKQYELITNLKPAVVGHFDLIRIFDPDYKQRIANKYIWGKMVRNLEACRKNDLILDFNTRALQKNAQEPYVSEKILRKAGELSVKVVPGDDSHGINDIGTYIRQGIKILAEMDFNTDWPEPEVYNYT